MQTTETALADQERTQNHKVKLALILDRTPDAQKGRKRHRTERDEAKGSEK